MTRRRTHCNTTALLLLLPLLCSAGASATEVIAAGEMPRNFADVPSWITDGIRIHIPESLGYSVNGVEYRGGYSLQNPAATERTVRDVPLWIQLAGISGILVFLIALIHFSPVMLGRVKKAESNPARDSVYSAICANPGSSAAHL